MGVVLAFWQANGASITQTAQTVWAGIQKIIGTVAVIVAEIVTRVFGAIAGFLDTHGDEIQAILTTVWENIRTVVDTTINAVQGILNTVLALIRGDWDTALTEIKTVAETVWDGIATIVQNNIDLAKGAIRALIDIMGEPLKETLSAAEGFFTPFKDALSGIKNAIQTVIDTVGKLISKFKDLANAVPSVLKPGSPTPFEIGMRGIAGTIKAQTIPALEGLSVAMTRADGGQERGATSTVYNQQRNVSVTQTFMTAPAGFRQDSAIVRSLAGV
jgi:phage-related protein